MSVTILECAIDVISYQKSVDHIHRSFVSLLSCQYLQGGIWQSSQLSCDHSNDSIGLIIKTRHIFGFKIIRFKIWKKFAAICELFKLNFIRFRTKSNINFRRQNGDYIVSDIFVHNLRDVVTMLILCHYKATCIILYYTVSQKTVQICFWQNLVKFIPILIIFGRKMPKRLELYGVHSFPPYLIRVTTIQC